MCLECGYCKLGILIFAALNRNSMRAHGVCLNDFIIYKVQNRLNNVQQFGHLPQRKPVEISFDKLSYSVREGSIFKQKGKWLQRLAKLKQINTDPMVGVCIGCLKIEAA